jgi:hypothetical protein
MPKTKQIKKRRDYEETGQQKSQDPAAHSERA